MEIIIFPIEANLILSTFTMFALHIWSVWKPIYATVRTNNNINRTLTAEQFGERFVRMKFKNDVNAEFVK